MKDHCDAGIKMGVSSIDEVLVLNESDETIADLITDGCSMGVKSLHKYLNQYKAADKKSKDITKRLINIEEKLALDIREYFKFFSESILEFLS